MAEETTLQEEGARKLCRANADYRRAQGKGHFVPFLRPQAEYILSHSQLSPTEKMVWFSIALRTTARDGNVEKLTVAEIAAGAGLQTRATQTAIKALCTRGVLRKIQPVGNRPAHYYLIPPGEQPAFDPPDDHE